MNIYAEPGKTRAHAKWSKAYQRAEHILNTKRGGWRNRKFKKWKMAALRAANLLRRRGLL